MLENQVALVTGASRGIGQAIALALGGAGARVIGTSTSEAGAARFGEALASHGCNGRGAVLDVGAAASIDALMAQLEAAGELPTILVNNAAITRDTLLLRMKAEDWDAVIATNLTGPVPAVQGLPASHDEGAPRPHRQPHLRRGRDRQPRTGQLRRGQSRPARFHQVTRARARLARHHGECGGARASSTPT